jgi:hypothetical protein
MAEISGVYGYGQYGYALYGIATWTDSDTITFSDTVSISKLFKITLSDTILFADSVRRNLFVRKILTESFSFSDSIASLRTVSRTLSDTISFADVLSTRFLKAENTSVYINGRSNSNVPIGAVVSGTPTGYVTSTAIRIIKSTPYFNGVVYVGRTA